jgi:hypothetical protein
MSLSAVSMPVTMPAMAPVTCFIRIALSKRAATASILEESLR